MVKLFLQKWWTMKKLWPLFFSMTLRAMVNQIFPTFQPVKAWIFPIIGSLTIISINNFQFRGANHVWFANQYSPSDNTNIRRWDNDRRSRCGHMDVQTNGMRSEMVWRRSEVVDMDFVSMIREGKWWPQASGSGENSWRWESDGKSGWIEKGVKANYNPQIYFPFSIHSKCLSCMSDCGVILPYITILQIQSDTCTQWNFKLNQVCKQLLFQVTLNV